MTVLTAETPTLSPANKFTNTALLNAMAALHRLNELGLSVRSVSASPTHGALIVIDPRDNMSQLDHLESALKARMVLGQSLLVTRVAHVLGCQVEWSLRGVPTSVPGQTVWVAA